MLHQPNGTRARWGRVPSIIWSDAAMSDYANQTFAALCDLSPSSHCDYEFDLSLIQKNPDHWPFVHIDVPNKGTVLYFLPS
jgi:hypothetical protein